MIVRTRYYTNTKLIKEEFEVIDVEDFADTVTSYFSRTSRDDKHYINNLPNGIEIRDYDKDELVEDYQILNFDSELKD